MPRDSSIHRFSFDPSGGFTLLELLVVASIILVLAGILMPVLAHSRRTARTLKSQSNLRQIGLLTEMYKSDHKNLYPRPAEGTFRGEGDLTADERVRTLWYNAIDEYAGLRSPQTVAERQDRNDEAWKQSAAWADIPEERQAANRTFKMNKNFADDGGGRYQTKGHLVRHPDRTVVYGDGQAEDMEGQTSIANASNFSLSEGIVGPRNPGKGVNIVFADGHVSAEYQPLKMKSGSTVYACPGWYSETDKKGGTDRRLIWNFMK